MRTDALIDPASPGRDPSLDAARGLAVVAMVALHLIPTEGDDVLGWRVGLAEAVLFLTGKCAALFCFAAGVVWAGRPASWGVTLRRALALFAFGLVLGRLLWPTEVLSALALMMVAVRGLRRVPTAVVLTMVVGLLTLVPWARGALAGWITQDWDEWGLVHAGETGFHPAAMLRGWVYTGNYPLLPWLAFPLVGVVYARTAWHARRPRRIALASALVLGVAGQVWQAWSDARWDSLELSEDWFVLWVPTTIPFVLQGVAWAVVAVAGCREVWEALPRARRLLGTAGNIGRASLTWYAAHLALVIAPLRITWPDEDWPFHVGIVAFVGWFVFAALVSALWFARRSRGPLEAVWGRLAGVGSR